MPFLQNLFGGGGGAQPAPQSTVKPAVMPPSYHGGIDPGFNINGPGGMPGGMPMVPGPGGGDNPMQGIIQMLIQQMIQQFMGRQQPSTFTPGGPGAPDQSIQPMPDNPLMRIQPMPGPIGRIGEPGYGIRPPWMQPHIMGGEMKQGVNPIADAQGPMGNMQGPMSFLSQFMNMRKPLDPSDREFGGKDRM